tara:strand:+ start:4877 stop:5245 length:369 start_codon:yes stop_codon:yes gene_type:complete
MKTLVLIACIFIGCSALADNHKQQDSKMEHKDHKKHEHKDSQASAKKVAKDKLLIKVKGMVCAFCAQGIEKNFNAREEVKNTEVDLDKMQVLVTFVKGKSLAEDVVKEIVTGAGFQFAGVVE